MDIDDLNDSRSLAELRDSSLKIGAVRVGGGRTQAWDSGFWQLQWGLVLRPFPHYYWLVVNL